MSDEEIAWVVDTARWLDCLVFVIVGRYGSQPVLLPRSLYGRSTTLHQD